MICHDDFRDDIDTPQETHRKTQKHSPRDRHRHTQICIKSCLIEAYHVDFRNVKPSHELVIRRANH